MTLERADEAMQQYMAQEGVYPSYFTPFTKPIQPLEPILVISHNGDALGSDNPECEHCGGVTEKNGMAWQCQTCKGWSGLRH